MGLTNEKQGSPTIPLYDPDVSISLKGNKLIAARQGARMKKFSNELHRMVDNMDENQRKSVQIIDVSYNWLSEVDDDDNVVQFLLRTFVNAQELNLNTNNWTSIDLKDIDGGKLTKVDISSNPITQVPPLVESFRALTSLEVENCILDFPPDISTLPSLKTLNLAQNRFPGEFKIEGGENTLVSLTLRGNSGITNFCGLGKLKSLRELDISFCSANSCEEYPEFVEVLDISFNDFVEFPDAVFELNHLTNLRALKVFRHDCRKKFPSLLQIQAISKTIKIFNWCMNQGPKNIPSSEADLGFSSCLCLEELRLRSCMLQTMPIISSPTLKLLDMSGNQIESIAQDYDMERELPSLKVLCLGVNSFSKVPDQVKGVVQKLDYLWMQCNPLEEDKEASEIGGIGFLRYLRGDENKELVVLKGVGSDRYERIRDKIKGVVYGAALGDCIGTFTEFFTIKNSCGFYNFEELNVSSKPIMDRHRLAFVKDWTDDTDQMLLIMRAMREAELEDKNGGMSFSAGMKKWASQGYPELGDVAGSGMGYTTMSVLNNALYDENPEGAAKDVWEKRGKDVAPNGGVMRCAASGCLHFDNIDTVIGQALCYCGVTHYDPRCKASVIAVSVAVAKMILEATQDDYNEDLGVNEVIEVGFKAGSDFLIEANQMEYVPELEKYIHAKSYLDLDLSPEMIGYTFKTLGAGFYSLKMSRSLEEAARDTTMQCGDADTNGAVAGALVGCRLGYSGLPKSWIEDLKHKDWLETEIQRFLDMPYFKQFMSN